MKMYGFIVEGTHDKDLLIINFNNVRVIECRGTRINNKIKNGILELMLKCDEVYILTDPDDEGDRFAERLMSLYPFKRLRLNPDDCKLYLHNRVKIGVEHISVEKLYNFMMRNQIYLNRL